MSAKEEVKAGWKTTEFWLSTIAMLAGTLIAAGVIDPEGAGTANKVAGLVVSALAAMGYSVSRGLAKGSGK